MRRSDVIETGDIHAEPGSRTWAAGLRLELWRLLDSADTDHKGLNGFLETMNRHEGWRALTDGDGKPFADFPAFCVAARPFGLSVSAAMVRKWCEAFEWAKEAQQLAADDAVKPQPTLSEAMKGNRNASKAQALAADENLTPLGTIGENRTSDRRAVYGESAAYLVRRLKRDAPEVASALARGEYPSARAAGIAAGIVKVPTPLDLGKKAWAKMSKKERTKFLAWLYTPEANEDTA